MVDVKSSVKKYWWVWILAAIVIFGFWARTGAMRYSDLPDIDTYYFLRLNEYVLGHDFQMPAVDVLRNWPYGDRGFDLPLNFYLPSAMYVALNPLLNMSFYRFAFIQPVILAGIAMVLMFWLAYELFDDKKKALFSAFFFATIPAAITRLSAGEIEKEANSVVFMLLAVIFFFKAYRCDGWKWKGLAYGVLSGVFVGVTAITWGGAQLIYIVITIFAFIMLLINRPQKLLHSFVPFAVIGLVIPLIFAYRFTSLANYNFIFGYVVIAMLAVRLLADRFNVIKKESLKFLSPALVVLLFIGTLVGSMFSDFVGSMLSKLVSMITLYQPGLTTVAESIPGDWNTVLSQSGLSFAQGMLPQLTPVSILLSAWLLMLLGAVVMFYKFARYRELVLIFPVAFLGFSVFGVFYALRLAYFVGFSAALASGFFVGWFVDRASKVKTISSIGKTSLLYLIAAGFFGMVFVLSLSNLLFALSMLAIAVCLAIPGYAMRVESQESWIRKFWTKIRGIEEVRTDLVMIPVVIFVVLLAVSNMANAYSFGNQLGPSINPYINDAMKFLREQTPENTSVLSWWDFGYWFQYVGKRATIVDGGGSGDTSRYDVAIWFTDDASNWSNWAGWLNGKLDVGYILMDYTLPGKYGAITKIASHETTVVGILQFEQTGTTQQGDTTIYEFGAGPYRIWLPIGQDGNIAGTPIFLVTDGTRYSNKAYINDLCTEKGIASVGNESQSIGGCIAMTGYGLFYVPPEAEHTIFTSLMFMDGYNLVENGLKKVFDNGLIHIYDLKDATNSS